MTLPSRSRPWPTVVFGALSVTDHWLPTRAYAVSAALLVVYVLAGIAVSLLILSRIDFFTRHFTPSPAPDATDPAALKK